MTKAAVEKEKVEKVEKTEKRRALGRGLESLLPGPRVVSSESRVPSTQYSVASTQSQVVSTEYRVPSTGPQGLKPHASPTSNGTAEAVPFPDSAGGGEAGGERGGVGEETEIPRFARNDSPGSRDDKELSSDGNGLSSGESGAADAAGQPRAVVPTWSVATSASPPFAKEAKGGAPSFKKIEAEEGSEGRGSAADGKYEQWPEEPETIEIQAMAMPSNLVVNLAISLIEKNPYQTRYMFDEEAMEELCESIKEHGVVQPIVVRPTEEDEGRYILVLGERRLRASKMAGKETIPAIVRRLGKQQAAEMTVLENVVREDLNPLEQAEAFRVLSQEFNMTQTEIAVKTGASREKVANYMRLLRLPQSTMEHLLGERLSFSDCREILALDDPEEIEKLAEEVVKNKLKVEEIERRVSEIKGFLPVAGQAGVQKKGGGARWVDPNVRAAQMEMERTLGMRVRIRDRKGKGRIMIEYASVDDYEKVVGLLRRRS